MDSLLLVDKPKGWTSHDVVAYIRQLTRWKKVGHFGSLDPLATGLLLIGLGAATRLFPVLSRLPKTYTGRIRFGQATDTYDAEGHPLAPPSFSYPEARLLDQMMQSFVGEIEQLPPPFSAKKYHGRPVYRLARRGETVHLRPVKVEIYRFVLIHYDPPDLDFELSCSSGTYVRSLAHHLGLMAGCGAHLASLKRLAAGPYRLEEAYSVPQIEIMWQNNQLEQALIPLEKILEDRPKAVLINADPSSLSKKKAVPVDLFRLILPAGGLPPLPEEKIIFRLFIPDGRFMGLSRRAPQNGYLLPFLLL